MHLNSGRLSIIVNGYICSVVIGLLSLHISPASLTGIWLFCEAHDYGILYIGTYFSILMAVAIELRL